MTLAAMGGFFLLLLSSSSVEGIVLAGKQLNLPLAPGGMLGHWLGKALAHGLGQSGAYLLLSVTGAIGFSLFTGLSWLDIMEKSAARWKMAC
jgi:S-DNA-T family DNA segregation ATPase FtsK/SpoIIIE